MRRNAVKEEREQEGICEQFEGGAEGWEAEEAGVGDSLRRAAEGRRGEGEEAVADGLARRKRGAGDFIYVTDNVRCWLVRAGEISALEVKGGNYIRVTMKGATALIRGSLGRFETRLDPQIFFRTGRGCIVNLMCVREVIRHDKKRFLFVMVDGSEVLVSSPRSLYLRKHMAL